MLLRDLIRLKLRSFFLGGGGEDLQTDVQILSVV